MKRKVICLLSGGLDSAVCAYEAHRLGYEVIGLNLNYGQRHFKEILSARAIAKSLKIQLYEVDFQMPWRGSSLTDKKIAFHDAASVKQISRHVSSGGIPNTYVPARNSVFLALAASCAEAESAVGIFIGANAVDYSGYPDCRPQYLKSFERMMKLGTKAGTEGKAIQIFAPLLRLSKKEIILKAIRLGVPLQKTWSCYRGEAKPCKRCDSCLLRAKGFEEAGVKDPTL